MILPKDIVGQNKLRDLQICEAYCGDQNAEEIAEGFKLTERRVYYILQNNSEYVLKNVGWSKSKRIKMLQKIADNAGIQLSPKKDILNVIEQMRKEIEGDKPLIKQESHYHFTTVVEELHATAKGSNDRAGKSNRDISSLEG